VVAILSITDRDVMVAVRLWAQDLLGSTTEVIQELGNRVPTPKSDFVLMSRLVLGKVSTPVVNYIDQPSSVPSIASIELVTSKQPTNYAIQMDCYGDTANDRATMISAEWPTLRTCELLQQYGIQPLWNEDPRQTPFITGEKQYSHRWVVVLHLQYNPAVSLGQDFMSEAEVSIINVDRTYPA
jgi:hypothetical protein